MSVHPNDFETPLVQYEPEEDVPLGTAVVEAVVAVTNSSFRDLPLLYDTLDPDVLDALFSTSEISGRLGFRYAGYEVVVYDDRTVEVYDPD